MKIYKFDTSLEIEGEDLGVTVSFEYAPDEPATLTYPGAKAEVYLDTVTLDAGDIGKALLAKLEELAFEHIEQLEAPCCD